MDFQREMSNTAHQRQVKDLRAAGLNPILSAKYGGASTPPGATAPQLDTMTPAIGAYNQSSNAKVVRQKGKEEVKLLKNQQTLVKEQQTNVTADTFLKGADAEYKRAHAEYLKGKTGAIPYEIDRTIYQAYQAQQSGNLHASNVLTDSFRRKFIALDTEHKKLVVEDLQKTIDILRSSKGNYMRKLQMLKGITLSTSVISSLIEGVDASGKSSGFLIEFLSRFLKEAEKVDTSIAP